MTTIDELARVIADSHGIDSHGAALGVVHVYVGQIADDPDLYDPTTRELTEAGTEVVTEAVAAATAQDLYGTRSSALLDAMSVAALAITEKTAERDSLIRAAMNTGLPRAKIAAAAGVTEARLYQIRDGRR